MLVRAWFILTIVLIHVQNIYNTCPCGYKKNFEKRKELKEKKHQSEKVREPESLSPYLDQYMCNYVKKTIDYKVVHLSKDTHIFSMSPACLRCGVCLAVAVKLNETLVVAHETAFWLKKLDDDYVVELLRSLCNNGFENYGLREIDGQRMISEANSYSRHVSTEYDGQWTKNLQKLCHHYLDEFGELKLYNTWLNGGPHPPGDMVNTLCRNDRIFRDCMNIEVEDLITAYPGMEILKIPCP